MPAETSANSFHDILGQLPNRTEFPGTDRVVCTCADTTLYICRGKLHNMIIETTPRREFPCVEVTAGSKNNVRVTMYTDTRFVELRPTKPLKFNSSNLMDALTQLVTSEIEGRGALWQVLATEKSKKRRIRGR